MNTGRRFLVYGAGGHGKVVADAGVSSGLELAGFLDDDEAREGTHLMGVPVIFWGRLLREREQWKDALIALGLGENAIRQRGFQKLQSAHLEIATVVHRTAVISPCASLGPGTVVMAGVVVNPQAHVGAGAILNTGCVVEHDVVLGDFVHLSPNVALGGGVKIGARSHLGLGAVALPLVEIGADVRVGAGAAVIRDLPDRVTAVGVPARVIS